MGNEVALSQEAQAIVSSKVLSGRKRLSEWMPLLRELSEFDQGTDAAYAKAKGLRNGFLAGTIITGFLTIFGFIGGGLLGIVPMILFLGCLITCIVFGIRAAALEKQDLENDLRETLIPVLAELDEDIDPKGRILLDMSLTPGDSAANQTSKQPVPSRFTRLVETRYDQRACSATIPLLNGSRLTLLIDKTYLRYDRTYRSRSGKTKHKTKWKALVKVCCGLIPQGSEFGFDQAELGRLESSGKIKQGEKKGKDVCQITRQFKMKGTESTGYAAKPQDVIGMFVSLCKATAATGERS